MLDNLTAAQKREYLRLLLAQGQEAANAYLTSLQKPLKWIFETEQQVDEYYQQYRKETGDRKQYWAMIIQSEPDC